MFLIVGLGNPGNQYQFHRHNVGFMATDTIAQHFKAPAFTLKSNCLISQTRYKSTPILFLKPQQFMNKSGPGVNHFAHFFKIEPEKVVVIHDELDLELGRVKTKIGGSAGGHNGLRSIDAHFANNTTRIRIGIDHPGHRDLVTNHVLSNFQTLELEMVKHILDRVALQFSHILEGNLGLFQNHLSEDLKQLKP